MTLTVKVRFKTDKTLKEVFCVAQKVVSTPNDVVPIISKDSISNPLGVGAKALMWCESNDHFVTVALDQPYAYCHEMPSLIVQLIDELGLSSYEVYDESTGVWSKNNFDFLLGDSK